MNIMNADRLARQFQALGNPLRLRIIRELAEHAMCSSTIRDAKDINAALMPNVASLADTLKVDQSTLSNHLRVLYDVGLLRHWRIAHGSSYYILDNDALGAISKSITPNNG